MSELKKPSDCTASELFDRITKTAPSDFEAPDWEQFRSQNKAVHDWRSYISDDLKEYWQYMNSKTKAIVASSLQYAADQEERD